MLLQHRWRLGAGLVTMALAWTAVAISLQHAFSPLGHSPLTSRYEAFGTTPPEIATSVISHPVLVIRTYLFDTARRSYFAALTGPLAYLPVLCPWIFALSAPVLLINMLSDKVSMYSGDFQYNAEIVPILILSSIETLAVALVLLRKARARLRGRVAQRAGSIWRERRVWARVGQRAQAAAQAIAADLRQLKLRVAKLNSPRALRAGTNYAALLLLLVPLITCLHAQQQASYLPIGQGFNWPRTNAHTRLGDQLIASIPPTASVSAQNTLVPHLSNRRFIYLFPYATHDAQYVLLDTTSYEYSVDPTHEPLCSSLQSMLADPNYALTRAEDGYVLFERVPDGKPSGGQGGQPATLPFSVTACDTPQDPPRG
jgi:hypothetical protein